MTIRPELEFSKELLHIEKPGRYTGGEFGNLKPYDDDITITVALCFPDLYEIGMSNNAIRILYDLCNNVPHVLCDLVFCPAPDFEKLLKDRDVPLYTLGYGIPLHECDIVGFSVGYELAATNMLTVLETAKIPIHAADRKDSDPLIIAGGPAITNPVPFEAWLDGVYIGDAESVTGLPAILNSFVALKADGLGRGEMLTSLVSHPAVWSRDTQSVMSHIDPRFGDAAEFTEPTYYIAPNITVVQEHGVVEIMRGCPNGCRFCHAGEYYRPYRQKDIPTIIREVEGNIHKYGYREITLSSLSTGDYPHLDKLIESLNRRHLKNHVSFSLPSLKVNTFTLPVLKAVSTVRKSGLTFAIETPEQAWQFSLNKEVLCEDIITITQKAKALGWNLAKFYFMTGLPFTDREAEPEAIAGFLSRIYQATRIKMNINIGTFVPKPHTPFQWVEQFDPMEAHEHLKRIKALLIKEIPHVKVSFHESFTSFIEGMICRGDERVGDIVERAYRDGARLDAWEEHFDRNIWKEAIASADWDVYGESCRARALDERLPWEKVCVGGGSGFLKKEFKLAESQMVSEICESDCTHLCGICNPKQEIAVRDAKSVNDLFLDDYVPEPVRDERYVHIIATYAKTGKSTYYSHINMMKIFERMFLRLSIPIEFTHGFNPKPRLEFASPLPMGITGEEEIMFFRVPESFEEQLFSEEFIPECSRSLPEGITVNSVFWKGDGHKSISAAYSGSQYRFTAENEEDLSKLHALFARVIEEHPNVSLDSQEGYSVTVTIHEGKGLTGNILKAIDPIMAKYDFLSTYNAERLHLLAKGEGVLLTEFLSKPAH